MARTFILTVDLNVKGGEIEVRLQQIGILAFLQDAVCIFRHRSGKLISKVILWMVLNLRIILLFIFQSREVVAEVIRIGFNKGNLTRNTQICFVCVHGICLIRFLRTEFLFDFGFQRIPLTLQFFQLLANFSLPVLNILFGLGESGKLRHHPFHLDL